MRSFFNCSHKIGDSVVDELIWSTELCGDVQRIKEIQFPRDCRASLDTYAQLQAVTSNYGATYALRSPSIP